MIVSSENKNKNKMLVVAKKPLIKVVLVVAIAFFIIFILYVLSFLFFCGYIHYGFTINQPHNYIYFSIDSNYTNRIVKYFYYPLVFLVEEISKKNGDPFVFMDDTSVLKKTIPGHDDTLLRFLFFMIQNKVFYFSRGL